MGEEKKKKVLKDTYNSSTKYNLERVSIQSFTVMMLGCLRDLRSSTSVVVQSLS